MSAQNEDRATRLHAALDCVLDQKCVADGTSEGVKKAWETRRRGGGEGHSSFRKTLKQTKRFFPEYTRADLKAHIRYKNGEVGPVTRQGGSADSRLHRTLDCVLNKHLPPAA